MVVESPDFRGKQTSTVSHGPRRTHRNVAQHGQSKYIAEAKFNEMQLCSQGSLRSNPFWDLHLDSFSFSPNG